MHRFFLIFFFISVANSTDTISLPSVIVTGKKPDIFSLSNSIKKPNNYNLAKLLNNQCGVNVVGGVGTPTSVFIRGNNSDHTLVSQDGIIVNNPAEPSGFNSSHLLSSSLQEVNIIKGSNSAQDGAGSIGGSIYLKTPQGKGPCTATIQAFTGSFQTNSAQADILGKRGKIDYYLQANSLQSQGYNSYLPAKRLNDKFWNDPKYKSYGLNTNLGSEVGDRGRLGLIYRFQPSNSQYIESSHENNPLYQNKTTQEFTKLSFAGNPTKNSWFLDCGVGVNQITKNMSPVVDSTPTYEKKYNGKTTNAYLNNRLSIVNNSLGNFYLEPYYSFAVQSYHDDVSGKKSQKVEKNEHSFALGTTNETEYRKIDLWYRLNLDQTFGSASTMSTSGKYNFNKTTLHYKISNGIKNPSLSQLHDKKYGNKKLQPEKSIGFDLGASQLIDMVEIGSTFFWQKIKDLIVGNPLNNWHFENIDKATAYGFESFVQFNYNKHLAFKVDHTFLHAKDTKKNEQLKRRPMHTLNFNICYDDDSWSTTLKIHNQDKTVDTERFQDTRIYMKGFTTVDLSSKYKVNNKLNIFCWVENLLNRHYQNPHGYNQPGTAVFVGFKLKIW